MIHPRFKRNERLHEIALRSDWTFSAKLALGGLVVGVLLLPWLIALNPELTPLSRTTRFLGWVFAIGFAGVGIYRYTVQRREALQPPDDSEEDKS